MCQNGEWTLFSGYLSSPNYPGSFAASTHCTCTLATKDGSMFTLRTLEFHIPFKKRCRYSYFNKISTVLRLCQRLVSLKTAPHTICSRSTVFQIFFCKIFCCSSDPLQNQYDGGLELVLLVSLSLKLLKSHTVKTPLSIVQKKTSILLPPAYVVRREGNVLTRVCPSVCPQWGGGGGVPISHNAL